MEHNSVFQRFMEEDKYLSPDDADAYAKHGFDKRGAPRDRGVGS
jgi:hypothetical protein